MKKTLAMMAVALTIVSQSSASVLASERIACPPEALETLRHLAIQHNGRVKPLDSFARETLQLITGSVWVAHDDPVQTIMSIMADPDHWREVPLVSVPFLPLRDALGLDRTTTHVSYNTLVSTRKLMQMLPPIVHKQQRDEKLSMLENETMDAFQRFVALSGMLEQQLSLVPPPSGLDGVWCSIHDPATSSLQQQDTIRRAWAELMTAIRAGPSERVISAAHQMSQTLQHVNHAAYPPSWRLQLEVFYNYIAPFRVARVAYLLAVIGLLLSFSSWGARFTRWGLGLCGAAFVLHGVGIAMRVILGGRPPVSNFFETTLWLPFVAVALALVLERIYRARYIALAASLLAAITLLLADHLPLDSSISPVVAVLHSNLWLTVHVLTIVASYGALALAMVLAHVYGWLYLVRRGAHAALPSLETFLYRVIQVGVVLLAAGIMLGAVWANASWGRYWGWDPKETWALITLLWFLALLHARSAEWVSGVGVALSTIGGFFLLLMTYYGVSFYLVGLHSYAGGHATPIPRLLIVYLVAELIFMVSVGVSALVRHRAV